MQMNISWNSSKTFEARLCFSPFVDHIIGHLDLEVLWNRDKTKPVGAGSILKNRDNWQ